MITLEPEENMISIRENFLGLFFSSIRNVRKPRPKCKNHRCLFLPPHLDAPNKEDTQCKGENICNHIKCGDRFPSRSLFALVSLLLPHLAKYKALRTILLQCCAMLCRYCGKQLRATAKMEAMVHVTTMPTRILEQSR